MRGSFAESKNAGWPVALSGLTLAVAQPIFHQDQYNHYAEQYRLCLFVCFLHIKGQVYYRYNP